MGERGKFSVPNRKRLLAFLVSAFALQTFLVYSDPTGRAASPLTASALAGRAVWLERNCQSCHQFYGFGGFIGPDLTNAAQRLTRSRLTELLTEGIGQMPAFHLSGEEIAAVEAYLREMDATGIGQARVARPDPDAFRQATEQMIGDGILSDDAAAGAGGFLSGTCTACHIPFAAKRIGQFAAPDLSISVNRLSDADILTTLEQGRPIRGMPPTGLSAEDRGEILAFLRWLATNRERFAKLTSAERGKLPWFEFR